MITRIAECNELSTERLRGKGLKLFHISAASALNKNNSAAINHTELSISCFLAGVCAALH
jgi:hypothetical protein